MAESPAKLVERSRASNSDFPATLPHVLCIPT
jgi:hypothetical protein